MRNILSKIPSLAGKPHLANFKRKMVANGILCRNFMYFQPIPQQVPNMISTSAIPDIFFLLSVFRKKSIHNMVWVSFSWHTRFIPSILVLQKSKFLSLSLCRLCHWSFDEGLMSVGKEYEVLVSRRVRTDQNMPGHMLTLTDRRIFGPTQQTFWPGHDNLDWHCRNSFRR
jgi:hypothetical protein